MKVDVYELSDDQTIRRFVDLPKLFELLLDERAFFPALAALKCIDPFECAIALPRATRNLSASALKSEARSLLRYAPQRYLTGDVVEDMKRHEKLLKHARISELRQHVAEMRLMLLSSRIVCNCWHLSETESDAMWKLYGNGVGVMLVSTVKRLCGAIKGSYSRHICSPNPQEYSIAPISYVDERSKKDLPEFYLQRPWLLKRASFAHEQEIRVSHEVAWMAFDPGAEGILINLDPRTLISEIVLSPFNPEWANTPIAAALDTLLQARGFALPIRRSDHMNAPASESKVLGSLEFLRLGDTVRGRRLRMEPFPDYQNVSVSKQKPSRSLRDPRIRRKARTTDSASPFSNQR